MTQRIFDIENEKDMADLWNILPDDANEIEKDGGGMFIYYKNEDCTRNFVEVFNINWHDKTEIFRPIKEATDTDIGKLCKFWDNDGEYTYGILKKIELNNAGFPYKCSDYWQHVRRVTKKEIEEIC